MKYPVDRFPASHPMFSQLNCLLVSQLAATDSQHWCPLAEQGIAMVYKLSEQPDRFAEELLRDLVKQIFSSEQEDGETLLLHQFRHFLTAIYPHRSSKFSSAESALVLCWSCLLYTSPSPRDATLSRMPSSA